MFHHGTVSKRDGWTLTTQGLSDSGVDAIHSSAEDLRVGFQVKCSGDFNRNDRGGTFHQKVLSQIQASRAHKLKKLYLILAADLTNSSHLQKCRGLLNDLSIQGDGYVELIEPEAAAGLWRWSTGVSIPALEQMFDAGYAYLTVVFDNLGNSNSNSWGKGTGGDWSVQRTRVLRVGNAIHLRALARCRRQGDIEFRFSVQLPGTGLEVRRDWSQNSNWTWHVEERDIGKNVVVAIAVRIAKSFYQFDQCDDYCYATYDILPLSASN